MAVPLGLFMSWREAWASWSAACWAASGLPPAAWDWEARAAWTDWAAAELPGCAPGWALGWAPGWAVAGEDGEALGEGFWPPMPTGDVGSGEGVAEAVPCGVALGGFWLGFWLGFWAGAEPGFGGGFGDGDWAGLGWVWALAICGGG